MTSRLKLVVELTTTSSTEDGKRYAGIFPDIRFEAEEYDRRYDKLPKQLAERKAAVAAINAALGRLTPVLDELSALMIPLQTEEPQVENMET